MASKYQTSKPVFLFFMFFVAMYAFIGTVTRSSQQLESITETRGMVSWNLRRRFLLSGPGSSPPRCTTKCGRCNPCKPVHVPVPPGTPVTAEYYPEAWRCKCGNRLYMP